ncbi:MAG: hypothetical protein WCI92_03705 [Bacteroidota bacterium]
MRKILAVLAVSLGLLTSCSKDGTTTNYTPSCNGTVKSYQANVAPIISSACAGCHQNFSTYSQLYASRNSVRSQVVSGNMPQSGSLSTTQKDAIACWIDNGAPNN